MKNSIAILITTGVLAVCLSTGLWAQSQPKSDTPSDRKPAWQHLALEHEGKDVIGSKELAQKINGLGDEGWQLVDVETIAEAGTTTSVIFYFKRPK